MKKLIVLPLVAIVVIVAVVGGASIVRASHGHTDGSSGFADRVAEILGIAPEDVSAAIAQARSEKHAAHIESLLAEAVAAGVITEEEAAAIFEWISGKLDALHSVKHLGLRSAAAAGEVEAFLADLVAQEVITGAESAEISVWLELRPTATDQLREWRREQFKNDGHRFHRGGCKRGYGGSGHHNYDDPDGTSDAEVSISNPV